MKNIILGNSEPVVNESQPGIGLHSVSFKNYDELSEKIEDTLEELIIEMKNEKADTASIENYKTNILSKQSVSLPFSDGKEIPLRNEDGYSNITFSYIKIFYVSSEVKTTGTLNTYDFMNAINPSPEKGLFYSKYDSISKENVIINGKTVEVVFRNIENDPRVYADFLYGDSLVFVCCSKEKIDSGFLESLSIADLPLKSSEQEAEPGDIQKLRAEYPEYFEMNTGKGIEVYAWRDTSGKYCCVLMAGTNRNKEIEEISELRPLTFEEAKLILNDYKVNKDDVIIIPIGLNDEKQFVFETDKEYADSITSYFKNYALLSITDQI